MLWVAPQCRRKEALWGMRVKRDSLFRRKCSCKSIPHRHSAQELSPKVIIITDPTPQSRVCACYARPSALWGYLWCTLFERFSAAVGHKKSSARQSFLGFCACGAIFCCAGRFASAQRVGHPDASLPCEPSVRAIRMRAQ
jgi:hypothetical protein